MERNITRKKVLISLILIGIIFSIVIVYLILKETYSIKIEELDGVVINDLYDGEVIMSCDKSTLSLNQTATCTVTVKEKVVVGNFTQSYGFSSFSAKLELDDGLTLENISFDDTIWHGDVSNGKIDLYVNPIHISSFNFEILKFVVKANDLENVGSKKIILKDIIVSAHEFKEYTVGGDGLSTTVQVLSTDANLSELSIEGIDFNFSPDVTTYNIKTNNEEIIINAVTSNEYAKVIGDGTQKLNYGNNILNITVVAESGVEKIYTLIVLRENENVNFDKDVLIDTKNGYLIFSLNNLTESLTVKNVLDKIFTDASVSITGNDGNIIENYSNVSTGCKIKIYTEEEIIDEYIIVIKGDVNGTGVLSVNGVKALIKHYLATEELESDEYISAGDVNNDGKISINDIIILSKKVIEMK